MENENSMNKEHFKMPYFFKMNKIKIGGEENDKLFQSNQNQIKTNENTRERVQFLFPDLSQQDVKQVLERAEYNIEKTIELLKLLKQEQRRNETKNDLIPKYPRKIKKRNYLELNQKTQEKHEDNKEINNININNKAEEIKQIESNSSNSISNSNNSQADNNDIINKIINNINEEKKNLINSQINVLLNKFAKMQDISELKKLLIEIGFPLIKPDPEKEKADYIELQKKLDEKVKQNESKKNAIINLYKQYTETCEQIKKKQDINEELSNTLGNLIEVEAEQKIRKEIYENELKEYENIDNNNNFFNGPKEGC